MNDVVIVSAVRTPIGKIRGTLSQVRPDDLAAIVHHYGVTPHARVARRDP